MVSLTAPDRTGKFADVVLGMDSLDGYQQQTAFLRGADRPLRQPHRPRRNSSSTARPTTLPKNDGREHPARRHRRGSTSRSGQARELHSADGPALELTYVSKDGEEGFPGTLTREGGLHADREERAEDRLHRHHRQGHGGQPDQPLLFQPGGRGRRRHSRAPGDDQRRPVHAGGCRADSHRRVEGGEGHAVRFHEGHGHRRAHRRQTTSS